MLELGCSSLLMIHPTCNNKRSTTSDPLRPTGPVAAECRKLGLTALREVAGGEELAMTNGEAVRVRRNGDDTIGGHTSVHPQQVLGRLISS